ncbi:MAG: amidohydrolase family protein [Lysobacterales bacterium]|jgi:predicted TIM-barrel fold metal-dependent hydrolase
MNKHIARCLSLLLLTAGASNAAEPVSAGLSGADHHMHIRSADAVAAWDAVCEKLPPACPEGMRVAPVTTADDALRALDRAGLEKGALLSLGYFYGMPELAGTPFDSAERARAENRYVADQVKPRRDRLAGFFSVNPLADYALDEVEYWAQSGELTGLKLHFANSGVDLRDPEQLARLRALFEVLDAHAMPAIVHLRNRDPDYGYEDAANFIEQVASQAPHVPLYIAHLAGWGGFDPATDAALQAFLDAFQRGVLDRERVWFDIAAIVHPSILATGLEAVPARLRQIGLDHVLFATDWDRPVDADRIAEYRAAVPLTDAEWSQVLSNQAPYFNRSP